MDVTLHGIKLRHPLVIYTQSGRSAFHGLVIEQRGINLKVYSFHDHQTVTVTERNCLPFHDGDYETMGIKDFWKGITVQLPDDTVGTVVGGYFRRAVGESLTLHLEVRKPNGGCATHELSSLVILSHVNARA